ncbi:MAG: hypothetical protein WCI18_13520 [Pseudomonadota bacterium]
MIKFLCLLLVCFPFIAHAEDEALVPRESENLSLTILSVKTIKHESPYFIDQVDLVITAKAATWRKERTETMSGIMLGGRLSTPGSLSSAMTFVRVDRLIACKSILDRQENNCVDVARVDERGLVDAKNLEAFYTKIELSPEQKIFCSLVSICANRDFDFITLEYSPN